jgi:hypothetical protein
VTELTALVVPPHITATTFKFPAACCDEYAVVRADADVEVLEFTCTNFTTPPVDPV